MVSPVHKAVTLELFQRQAEHALRDAKVAFEFIEPHRAVFGQRDHDQHTPPIADPRQNFVNALAIGAAFVVQHGGSPCVTEVQKCAFLRHKLVPHR